MNVFIGILTLAVSAWMTGCSVTNAERIVDIAPSATPAVHGETTPVLVELFTSEGCSNCPPADKVLTILQNNRLNPTADVITLGFHVDYWDSSSWKDHFSSAEFTRRQEAYASHFGLDSAYTPQMVVDGTTQLVGSQRGRGYG